MRTSGRSRSILWLFLLLAVLIVGGGAARAAGAKYYLVVRGVEATTPKGVAARTEAQRIFVAELNKHPEVLLAPPAALPADPDALIATLKQRGLKALEVTLRILEVSEGLDPAPPGKQYRVLRRGVRLSVFGNSHPGKKIAIGGDGEAQVGAEVGRHDDLERQGRELMGDCLQTAIAQAVDMTVTKLNLDAAPEPKTRRKKRRSGGSPKVSPGPVR